MLSMRQRDTALTTWAWTRPSRPVGIKMSRLNQFFIHCSGLFTESPSIVVCTATWENGIVDKDLVCWTCVFEAFATEIYVLFLFVQIWHPSIGTAP
ncbi:hypothetical protein VNO80_07809 [Phaseolus coccineus]|uniref:Uncharacterized protein n=1 Tax=Phaseolus coccineus TaxID=3886 RepID=A0AAN9NPV6_PHACN